MDFDIPSDLTNLWRYMYHMYHLDAFTQVMPRHISTLASVLTLLSFCVLLLPRNLHWINSVLSCGSRYHQSLQTTTGSTNFPLSYRQCCLINSDLHKGSENEEARRTGNTDLHHFDPRQHSALNNTYSPFHQLSVLSTIKVKTLTNVLG